ncbi:MAG: TIGR01777 family protein [Gammaproteobacteria bacterium HGW-Gammaproteobacteria-3]|nr:MAG: TIGR01777 family protein [Gammaproteobacteria bacterium HGW-Gammaproteobacteria-3]
MKILITGGTGFIGSALTRSLVAQAHQVTVLTRSPAKAAGIFGDTVKTLSGFEQLSAADHYDVVINLAGAPIFAACWTPSRKQVLLDSRIGLTDMLVKSLALMTIKPSLLISGSAIGFYGDQGDAVLTEQAIARDDFAHRLCRDWENSALQAEQYGIRVCLIRTGLVLGQGGGILQNMLLPFRLGLGGRLGQGRQWMSWIHRQDWLAIAHVMIADNSMRGAYNATAPAPVTNAEFTQTLAACLKRPAMLPVPARVLKWALGEMSELVLGSQRVVPQRLIEQGFTFAYPELKPALTQILSEPVVR